MKYWHKTNYEDKLQDAQPFMSAAAQMNNLNTITYFLTYEESIRESIEIVQTLYFEFSVDISVLWYSELKKWCLEDVCESIASSNI